MKPKVYKFKFSRKVIYLGLLQILIAAGFCYLLFYLYEGGYIMVWFASFIVAILSLLTLSIPRRIEVSEDKIEIKCILELTQINIADIVKIRKVNPRSMSWIIPILGGYNFFGYYGLYFDLRRAERVKMYTTEWRYIVEIVDIYEDRYYLSCRERDAFVKLVHHLRSK